jgi:hypothetical protein
MLTIINLLLSHVQKGMALSLACSSADAHHTQSSITSCAEEQRENT